MPARSLVRRSAPAALACAALLSLASRAPAQIGAPEPPTLTVSGTASISAPADQVEIRLSVITQAPTASAATDENSRAVEAVMSALRDEGARDEEMRTSRFAVYPVYSNQRPQRDGTVEEPRIIAYRVENEVALKSRAIEKAGEFIAAAVEAGANNVADVTFSLADDRPLRTKAIAEAAKRARADADTLAGAAGVRLIATRRIDHQPDFFPPSPVRLEMMGRAAMAADVAAPPMSPGEIEVRATVSIAFETDGGV